jgi:hypothetical protein
VVEPFGFTDHFHALMAFEPASQLNKVYHLERIKSVEFLKKSFQFEDKHEYQIPDAFGFNLTVERHNNELELSLKEYLLLKNKNLIKIPYYKIQTQNRALSTKKSSKRINAYSEVKRGLEVVINTK